MIFNFDVSDIATDVSTLQTDVGNLQTDVGNLQTDVGDVSSLTTTATNLAGAVNELDSELGKSVLYYSSQAVNAASNAEIMRIPAADTDSSITTDTVVLECYFASPEYITGNVTWTSYAGYIAFTGTCTAATTANVVLGTKCN